MGGGIAWPVIRVTDMERSLDFYRGVLGFRACDHEPQGTGRPRQLLEAEGLDLLLELEPRPEPAQWTNDDLQAGIRHVGLKVDDIERWAQRVRDAGARFTMEPRDAFGDVRITFFLDPDGAHLELVQGNVVYSHPHSPALVAAERQRPVPATPRFDHIAISVGDRDRTVELYRQGVGANIIGELRQEGEPRGFAITYMQAGPAVLEIFSFDLPVSANPWHPGRRAPGLARIALGADDVSGAIGALVAGGATRIAAEADGEVVLVDPDGTPLEVRPAAA